MRILFFAGVALLIAAFVATASEVAARTVPGVGNYVSASELWAALSPRTFRAVEQWVSATMGPAAWNAGFMTVMVLPAWALFGVPGGVLAWLNRPHREVPEDFDPDEVFLFDELAKRAKEDGYADGKDDDRLPRDGGDEILASAREAGTYAGDAQAYVERPKDAAAPPSEAADGAERKPGERV